MHALRKLLDDVRTALAPELLAALTAVALVALAALASLVLAQAARAQEPQPAQARTAAAAQAPATRIAAGAAAHRALLVRSARSVWGLQAPVATFAAQVQQESGWRAGAVSAVGAQGLAQFMPATAAWMARVYPQLGGAQPYNTGWALRAMVLYDHWLEQRVQAHDACHAAAMWLAAYNGGLGWVQRDVALARRRGLDGARWWQQVESVNAGRSAANWRENRGYPRRILLQLEPAYAAGGWGPGVCA